MEGSEIISNTGRDENLPHLLPDLFPSTISLGITCRVIIFNILNTGFNINIKIHIVIAGGKYDNNLYESLKYGLYKYEGKKLQHPN